MQAVEHGVIVADDSALVREIVRSHLEPRFGNVYLVKNGLEAVETARGMQAKLVLLDYRMPRLDGIEACREIRQLTHYEKIPIVLLTAYDDPKARRDAVRAGVTMVVAKPFTPDQLLESVVPLVPTAHEADPTQPGLTQSRDLLNARRRIEAAADQRRYSGMVEKAGPFRDPWRR